MKKKVVNLIAITTCLALFLPVSVIGQEQENENYYPYSYARLNYVVGDVFVQRLADLGYEKGEVNLVIVKGDKLGTEKGRAEIHFGRRNFLRLDENSKVEFVALPEQADESIRLHLLEGNVYLKIEDLARDKAAEVHTPDGSFYVLDIGLYRFDVMPEGRTSAYVVEGELEAAGESGSVVLHRGEILSISEGRLLGDAEYGYSRSDAFEDWNETRETLYAQRSTRSYLPSALDEYEEELEDNGRWVYENPYGYVWVPYVSSLDWRPYLYGRWVWYPVIGWTWVSSEPWGWAVYHYGRWHWRFGFGWYWIPHHHWRPAWVHWWWHNDYIGWCPLSWYNRPVVIVNNHFYDRYHDSHFPVDNRAMTVIRRNQLQAPALNHRVVRASELRAVGRVSLKADQPGIKPVASVSGDQALRARKLFDSGSRSVITPRSGSLERSDSTRVAKPSVPGRITPGSLSRSGGTSSVVKETKAPSRSTPAVSGRVSSGNTPTRAIRSFPSNRVESRPETGQTARQIKSVTNENKAPVSRLSSAGSKAVDSKKPAAYPSRISRPAETVKKKDTSSSSSDKSYSSRVDRTNTYNSRSTPKVSPSRVSSGSRSTRIPAYNSSPSVRSSQSSSSRSSGSVRSSNSRVSSSSRSTRMPSYNSPPPVRSTSRAIGSAPRNSSASARSSSRPAVSSRSSISRPSQSSSSRSSGSVRSSSSSRSSGSARSSSSRSSSGGKSSGGVKKKG